MAKFNKQFKYKGYDFNMSVELNTRKPTKLSVRNWHTVITNCMNGNNYYEKVEVETYQLEECIETQEQLAINYIDKLTYKPQSFEEMILDKLGFS